MSVRMRHTRGHTGNRRSHHALSATKPIVNESGKLRLPHRLDETNGTYRGKQIVEVKAKLPKAKLPTGTHHERNHAHDHQHEAHEAKPTEAAAAEKEAKTKGRPNERSGPKGA